MEPCVGDVELLKLKHSKTRTFKSIDRRAPPNPMFYFYVVCVKLFKRRRRTNTIDDGKENSFRP